MINDPKKRREREGFKMVVWEKTVRGGTGNGV
jgi:hypothetical protein